SDDFHVKTDDGPGLVPVGEWHIGRLAADLKDARLLDLLQGFRGSEGAMAEADDGRGSDTADHRAPGHNKPAHRRTSHSSLTPPKAVVLNAHFHSRGRGPGKLNAILLLPDTNIGRAIINLGMERCFGSRSYHPCRRALRICGTLACHHKQIALHHF